MNKIEGAIQTIHRLDMKNKNNTFLNNIYPIFKVFITVLYIVLLTSINKYDLLTTLSMSIYLIVIGMIYNITVKEIWQRFKIVLALLVIIGISNPILDRHIIYYIGNLPITTGLISMITLILKGFFSIISSYFLILSTNIEEICSGLKKIHLPDILIITIMLIYRYIILFLKEVQRIWTAYSLRAPKQKGINYKVWGSMIGSLMIRSIDRANIVYQSMELRGFNTENYFNDEYKIDKKSVLYLILSFIIILIIRYIPIFELIGNLFV